MDGKATFRLLVSMMVCFSSYMIASMIVDCYFVSPNTDKALAVPAVFYFFFLIECCLFKTIEIFKAIERFINKG